METQSLQASEMIPKCGWATGDEPSLSGPHQVFLDARGSLSTNSQSLYADRWFLGVDGSLRADT